MEKIYLAGGLFNVAEKNHNLHLEKHLIALGYTIILPQREALKNYVNEDQAFDLKGIVRDCRAAASDPNNILVGNIDGVDADSGTVVEYTLAIAKTGRAILYRTDFRTHLEKELGINAMLGLEGTELIYAPCYSIELEEIEKYYKYLSLQIHNTIEKIK